MDKLKMHSPNLTDENVAKIRDLFPGCVTEARDEATGAVRLAIDFDQLRQELSDQIVEGPQERYRLDWPGKRESLTVANAPIAKTLRPTANESINFDGTRNIFVEGDNLDALKLLQVSYLGSIKLIYIDPPYNTGGDFVYDDDFSVDTRTFFQRSMQSDIGGNKLVANLESNGRFHSDWLSMIYPRLKLARNLLRDDGFIAVSIDDIECHSLKRIMDEIFGEENFVAALVWDRNRKNDAKYFSVGHEYMLVYVKSLQELKDHDIKLRAPKVGVEEVRDLFSDLRKEHGEDWSNISAALREFYRTFDEDDARLPLARFTKVDEKGPYRDDGNINWPGGGGPTYEVLHPVTGKPCKLPKSGWRYPTKKRFDEEVERGRIVFGEDETTVPRVRTNLFENNDQVLTSVRYSYAQTATLEFEQLFDGSRVFENPKNYKDISLLVNYLSGPDDIIMDFFAGSGSTAHGVFYANATQGGNRQCISVQIPEDTADESLARAAGYSTIADLCKDRIRRAGKKILEGECHPDWNRDVGFRVLKVDTSNMKDVYYRPDELKRADLLDMVDNVKEGRTAEDMLFQVLVDWGVDLTLPIRRETVQGKTVFFVDDNALAACFDTGVTEELVKALAGHEPLRVVFRDNGFVSDAVKINVEQIFRQLSPATDIKSI
ncbi:site-specific DNA-methyltransferase [Phenylobacterium sp.]|uniref:site-specific DNA-methyltransferase n=1 Tax=Phenylobacterium sp. TaxID=1871053 RepID=UPI0025E18F1E|nr:site-specific DNA-methyltransferase [Phenylobacterium sp.]MCA3585552.1 site-specific DNA-methyltransferase [Methylocystis sp.]MCA6337229.1 site-specific DNA-methyltransferase [Phenylobacterium sp.]MCA6360485.1 site-specific DNA-methyltransferase [Phenylobacterium sp.]